MSGLVLFVEFRLVAGQRKAFRRLIDENARESVKTEPGCRRFDVLEPDGEEDRILLYEIYDDRAAVDAHIGSAHYQKFDKASASLVAGKTVTMCDLVCEGSA